MSHRRRYQAVLNLFKYVLNFKNVNTVKAANAETTYT